MRFTKTLTFLGAIAGIITLQTPGLAASLKPEQGIGYLRNKEYVSRPPEFWLGTGTGSRAASSISRYIGKHYTFMEQYGTEGSIATFGIDRPGLYEITWKFYTSETTGEDDFYTWQNGELSHFANSAIADIQQSRTRWRTDWLTTELEIKDKISLITLDTEHKTNSSVWKIKSIQKVLEGDTIIAIAGLLCFLTLLKPHHHS